MKPLLVIGCGRSGTRYAKEVLASVGINLGHEVEGPKGTVDWHKVADPSGYSLVLHQVRHPIRVIESFHTVTMGRTWNFICKHEPRIAREESQLLRSMKYWLYWNLRAEAVAARTYRVEDMEDEIAGICRDLGVELSNNAMQRVRAASKQNHSRRKRPDVMEMIPSLSWVDLEDADSYVAGEIMVMARKYGYDLSV